jgi:dUTPase
VICRVEKGAWVKTQRVEELPESERGAGGFGSTGV